MALMMVLMVILLVALPGGHMDGGGALHLSQDQASQSHTSDAAKPVQEEIPQSAEHDAVKPNQEKR